MAEQNERAFQKQLGVNIRPKVQARTAKKIPARRAAGVVEERGFGLQDAKRRQLRVRIGHLHRQEVPFTGSVSIRGRILSGIVKSTKMNRTIIVRRNYVHFIKKYQRYEKRHTNVAAHISPAFRCNEGDTVIIGQCRPLSKTVRFNVLRVIPSGSSGKKGFSSF